MVQFSRPGAAVPPRKKTVHGLVPMLTALLLTSAAAQAQSSFLHSLDFDGDGVVTVEEAIASRNLQFPNVDLDGDGQLSAEEFDHLLLEARDRYASLGQAYIAKNASPGRIDAFTFSDSDADGYISRQEYYRSSARFARSLDRDGDGIISREDLMR